MSAIPRFDLEAGLAGSGVDRVDAACRETGFLVIENHGVPPTVIDSAWAAARDFFRLSIDRKNLVRAPHGCPRGYFPLESESLAQTRGERAPPDCKEAFSSGPLQPPAGHTPTMDFDFFYGANTWPEEPPGFRDAWVDYYRAMEALGARIMQLLAMSLGLDARYFATFHRHHLGALRALGYPADTNGDGPRAGAHSDYGSVTILRPDPAVRGLQVRAPDGNWIEPPLVEDGFIVNIGDLLARWTNDRWVSTLHRVVGGSEQRQSIAYFMNPDYDADISVIPTCIDPGDAPRYAPVVAGQYLLQQFRAAAGVS